jgi:hypothetical protein
MCLVYIIRGAKSTKKKTGTFLGVPVAKPGPEPTVGAQEKTVVNTGYS